MSGISKNFNEDSIKGVTRADDSYMYEETIIERKILLCDDELVFFNGNQHKCIKDFDRAATRLENHGLGELKKEKKNTLSSKSSKCFKKFNINDLDDDSQLNAINNLLRFHVDIIKYKRQFSKRKSEDMYESDNTNDLIDKKRIKKDA